MSQFFYLLAALWAVVMLGIFIQAIRLSYRIEKRSPELVNRTGLPQRAQMFHTVTNWKVARDDETQALRRHMNSLLLMNVAGFVLLWIGLYAAGAFEN